MIKKLLREIFSVQNINNHKVFSILGIKIKFSLNRFYQRGGGFSSNPVQVPAPSAVSNNTKPASPAAAAVTKQTTAPELAKKPPQQAPKTLTTKDVTNILNTKIKKITPATYIKRFEIHLTDHCNLNCKSCAHWSCLADEYFISTEDFSRDLKRMRELTDGYVDNILLLGGEPFLHPKITELIKIVHDIFVVNNPHKTGIQILTNGVLLNGLDDNIWQTLKEYNVTLLVSKYPVKVDYDAIEEKCNKLEIKICFLFTKEDKKTWFKTPMDLKGSHDPVSNFVNCWEANNCITLKDGKLYTCIRIPHVIHFNKYFNQNLEVTNRDYIDIYKAKDIDEILAFLAKPVPFCRYCGVTTRIPETWGVTKKEISEWT